MVFSMTQRLYPDMAKSPVETPDSTVGQGYFLTMRQANTGLLDTLTALPVPCWVTGSETREIFSVDGTTPTDVSSLR